MTGNEREQSGAGEARKKTNDVCHRKEGDGGWAMKDAKRLHPALSAHFSPALVLAALGRAWVFVPLQPKAKPVDVRVERGAALMWCLQTMRCVVVHIELRRNAERAAGGVLLLMAENAERAVRLGEERRGLAPFDLPVDGLVVPRLGGGSPRKRAAPYFL